MEEYFLLSNYSVDSDNLKNVSFGIAKDRCKDLGNFNFCFKTVHLKESSEWPDSSIRASESSYPDSFCVWPPIMTTPLAVGEQIIVALKRFLGNLGPKLKNV